MKKQWLLALMCCFMALGVWGQVIDLSPKHIDLNPKYIDLEARYLVDNVLYNNYHLEKNLVIPMEGIASVQKITNKDSIAKLGFKGINKLVIIFTEAYMKRSDSLKAIPSSSQLKLIGNIYYFKGKIYNGRYINYDIKGRKIEEGEIINGMIEGLVTEYYPSGETKAEEHYKNGFMDGWDITYRKNGNIKSKGSFKNGSRDGIFESYYPDGTIKEQSEYINDSNRLKKIDTINNLIQIKISFILDGKKVEKDSTTKVNEYIKKGKESQRKGEYSSAVDYFTKAIKLDKNNIEAYYQRGMSEYYLRLYEDQIKDFSKVIEMNKYYKTALEERITSTVLYYDQMKRTVYTDHGYTLSEVIELGRADFSKKDIDRLCGDLQAFLEDSDYDDVHQIHSYSIFCDPTSNKKLKFGLFKLQKE